MFIKVTLFPWGSNTNSKKLTNWQDNLKICFQNLQLHFSFLFFSRWQCQALFQNQYLAFVWISSLINIHLLKHLKKWHISFKFKKKLNWLSNRRKIWLNSSGYSTNLCLEKRKGEGEGCWSGFVFFFERELLCNKWCL